MRKYDTKMASAYAAGNFHAKQQTDHYPKVNKQVTSTTQIKQGIAP